jgi:hypothetical protein
MYRNLGVAGWAALSVILALTVPTSQVRIAGLVYFGIGISETLLGTYRGRMLAKLRAAEAAERTESIETTEKNS